MDEKARMYSNLIFLFSSALFSRTSHFYQISINDFSVFKRSKNGKIILAFQRVAIKKKFCVNL